MSVHVNSLIAYEAEKRNFSKREQLVYGYLTMCRTPQTDRAVRDALFTPTADMNAVRPRISDLIKSGWVREVGKVKSNVTGKRVRMVRAVSVEERARNEEGLLL